MEINTVQKRYESKININGLNKRNEDWWKLNKIWMTLWGKAGGDGQKKGIMTKKKKKWNRKQKIERKNIINEDSKKRKKKKE